MSEDAEDGAWQCRIGHPVEDWQAEVAAGDTRRGYEDWCDAREEQAEDEGNAYCRTCGDLYGTSGDGYDGECPSCADKTYEKEGQPGGYNDEN